MINGDCQQGRGRPDEDKDDDNDVAPTMSTVAAAVTP